MNRLSRWVLAIFLFGAAAAIIWPSTPSRAQSAEAESWIVGSVLDPQGEPIVGVDVSLVSGDRTEPLALVETQPNGRYALPVAQPSDGLKVQFDRPHYQATSVELSSSQIAALSKGQSIALPDRTLDRTINASFWIAAVVFVGMLVLIAFGVLHNTLSALLGASTLLAFSYLGRAVDPGYFVFSFQDSLRYIDWNVIFLIMGMMIVIAIVENTGVFQWLAFFAYRISGGHTWLLLPILMLITGLASAFLDNVTTMLLMTPITVQIALALEMSPLALLMPEVLASNVIGVSTLVGTPTNILIGSFAGISFNDFLANLTPGVLLAFAGLLIYSWLTYRKELASASNPSAILVEKLAERGVITAPDQLIKAGVVGAGMLAMFVGGEHIGLQPAVTALIGATALLVWIRPDVEQMIEAVDWTTLVFFLSLFIVVGGIQEVGLVSMLATQIGRWVGESLVITMLAVIWLSAFLSMLIANIPFTAAMLPVVRFLSATVPGANSKVLYYCLSVGAAMGGNGSLIGASANMVTAGIADSAGYPISYAYFLRKGLPVLLITVGLASIWLLFRFL
ncbi:MAG: SLC13 family permease [Anaerolineales bacterium]